MSGYNYGEYLSMLADAPESDGKASVNYLYPVLCKDYKKGESLSIIGECRLSCANGYVNGLGQASTTEYWYGLHPSISADEILKAISNGVFRDTASLEKYLGKNAESFTVPNSIKEYAKALFAKTIVKMATNFGVILKTDKGAFKKIKEFLQQNGSPFINDVSIDIPDEKRLAEAETPYIKFLGGLTSEAYEFLQSEKCLVVREGILIYSENKLLSDYTLGDYLLDKENGFGKGVADFVLVKGKAYYNGVLPRVTEIIDMNQKIANNSLRSYKLVLDRTTYATMDALDNSYIQKHPLLEFYRNDLTKIDREEEDYQQELRQHLGYNTEMAVSDILGYVNRYLKKSIFTHTLAISGNVITKDKYCIFALRDQRNIDANTFYCSVNGQTEIRDSNVEFYEYSCDADYPTIEYKQGEKARFTQEIEREAKAELNITSYRDSWEYCGLSFLCIDNSKRSGNHDYQRFHFNLLMSNSVADTFAEVRGKMQTAMERYENKDLIGIRVDCYKNFLHKIGSYIYNASRAIFDSKDFITSIIAVAIFISGLVMHESIEGGDLFNVIFTAMIGIFAGFLIAKAIIARLIIWQYLYRFRVLETNKATFLKETIINFKNTTHKSNKSIIFHPIAAIMFYLYLEKYANGQ